MPSWQRTAITDNGATTTMSSYPPLLKRRAISRASSNGRGSDTTSTSLSKKFRSPTSWDFVNLCFETHRTFFIDSPFQLSCQSDHFWVPLNQHRETIFPFLL